MHIEHKNSLSLLSLRSVFVEQTNSLYCAKNHLLSHLPELITYASFANLRNALCAEFTDTRRQMVSLQQVFELLNESSNDGACLGVRAVIHEAHKQVTVYASDTYKSDMTIIFYMSVIENLQLAANRIMTLISTKPYFKQYAQLVNESLDINKENAVLFDCMAKEYLENELN